MAVKEQEMSLAARRRKFNREAHEVEVAFENETAKAHQGFAEMTSDLVKEFEDSIKGFKKSHDEACKPFAAARDKAIAEAERKYKEEMARIAKDAGFGA